MSNPTDLRYTEEHEWARIDDDGSITVGITTHAQEALGDVVYVELPAIGDELEAGAAFGVVESVKAVSDLFSPVAGTVTAVNVNLDEQPEIINADPYGVGWVLMMRPSDMAEVHALMDAAAYEAFVAAETH